MACGRTKVELTLKEVLGSFFFFGNDIVKIIKLKVKIPASTAPKIQE